MKLTEREQATLKFPHDGGDAQVLGNLVGRLQEEVADLEVEVERLRLRLLIFKLTGGGYYGYECGHGAKIEEACVECDEAYETYKSEAAAAGKERE